MSGKIKVLICDDHPLFRAGVKAMLGQESWIQVVGEARDGREAVEQALSLRPDIVLMDLNMPGMNSLLATRQIMEARAEIRVLMLSMYDDEEIVMGCLEAGASGYVQKDAQFSQLIHALEVVRGDGTYLSPSVFKKLSPRHAKQLPERLQPRSSRKQRGA